MKYLELIKGQFTADHEARAKQEEPYVAYSEETGGVMFTVIPTPAEGPADNEIWYTSRDGNVVSLIYNDSTKFGANVVSNTYNNGNGVITFDGPVTIIGDYALDSFYATNIILPSSVKSIGDCAFVGAGTLNSVTVPNGVTSIGASPFAYINNDSLYVSYKGTVEQWNAYNVVQYSRDAVTRDIIVHCTDGDTIIPVI